MTSRRSAQELEETGVATSDEFDNTDDDNEDTGPVRRPRMEDDDDYFEDEDEDDDDAEMGQIDWDAVDEDDIPKRPVLPKGIYTGVVDEAEFKRSARSGNRMIEVQNVFNSNGVEVKVYDYIVVEPEHRARAKAKLRRYLGVLPKDFNPSRDADMLVGKQVRARLDVEKSKEYGERNRLRTLLPVRSVQTMDDDL
jgi:hypothetical protein